MDKSSDQTKTPNQPNQASRIVRAINAGKQIVIAVGKKPSIDQMVAAIGLASLINKQSTPVEPPAPAKNEKGIQAKTKIEILDTKPDSRATRNAVVAFAGQVHPKLGFLNTEKIITKTIDNYRELVIAIDKGKADKLRYSLDKKMARVHISPFLSNMEGLSAKDLEIGPGDYNIDVLVTIGVNEASELEPMIGDNIEMLKNRQTITMVADQPRPSQIFGPEAVDQKDKQPPSKSKKIKYQPINWCSPESCCLSEMVYELAKEMRFEVDETVATIILTGFLSATERVKSRNADAEQIEMISRLVKIAGIDNKQMVIDYIENENLKLAETATEPARQKVAVGSRKSTSEQLLTEQEATRRIQEAEVDPSKIRRGLGLQVASERRSAKAADQKEEESLIKDLDDVQVDESGQIIHGVAASKAKAAAPAAPPTPAPSAAASPAQAPLAPESPKVAAPVANPITDADKLGQQQAPPTPAGQPAGSGQQYQPSLIPAPETAQNQTDPNLGPAGQPAAT